MLRLIGTGGKGMRRPNHHLATTLFVLQMLLTAFAVGLTVHDKLAGVATLDGAGPAKVSVLSRTC